MFKKMTYNIHLIQLFIKLEVINEVKDVQKQW